MNSSVGNPGTMIPQKYAKASEMLKKFAGTHKEAKGNSDD